MSRPSLVKRGSGDEQTHPSSANRYFLCVQSTKSLVGTEISTWKPNPQDTRIRNVLATGKTPEQFPWLEPKKQRFCLGTVCKSQLQKSWRDWVWPLTRENQDRGGTAQNFRGKMNFQVSVHTQPGLSWSWIPPRAASAHSEGIHTLQDVPKGRNKERQE